MDDATPRIRPLDATGNAADTASAAPAAGSGGAALLGSWTVSQLARPAVWKTLSAELSRCGSGAAFVWDLRGMQQLDHVGAQRLWDHWGKQWPHDVRAEPRQQALLERVSEYSQLPKPRSAPAALQRLEALGAWLFDAGRQARDFTALIGGLVLDAARWARRPQAGPWRDFSGHLYQIGATALPITALVGFLIGVVLAYLLSQQLRQFGADAFIVNILGVSLIRELGPMLGAILVAGRSGSAITAQIGVMRVTEELDAMRVLGIAPGFRLVLPRAAALAIVMPLISVWTTLAALGGGMLASLFALGIGPSYFIDQLPKAVSIGNLWLATGKSAVFGVFIALIACHFGLRVKPDTQSLGEGTTSSVVAAITMVILVDALFAVVFKGVGM